MANDSPLRDLAAKGRHSIIRNPVDDLIWAEAGKLPSIDKVRKRMKHLKFWPNLMADVEAAMYKVGPKTADPEDLNEDARKALMLVEAMMKNGQFQSVKASTTLDSLSSTVATVSFCTAMAEQIEGDPSLAQALESAAGEKQEGGDGEGQGDGQGDGQGEEPNGGSGQGKGKGGQKEIETAASKALGAAKDAVNKAQAAMAGWGLTGTSFDKAGLGDRVELALKMQNDRFQKMAALIGKMRNLALSRRRGKLKQSHDEFTGLTYSDDLARVLPQEFSGITSNRTLKLLFYSKMAEKKLLSRELKPILHKEKGPMLVMVDKSGSMGGDPMDWAVAVALALNDMAVRQKRGFGVCLFDTEVVAKYRATEGRLAPTDMIEFSEVAAGGGTDYQPALEWAIETQGEQEFECSDFVMITDGYCALPDQFLAELQAKKSKLGLRIFTVVIGVGDQTPWLDSLREWSDQVWATGRPDDNVAGELFEQI